MTHCCSQCSFTAQFETALKMHHQLHHEMHQDVKADCGVKTSSPRKLQENTRLLPQATMKDIMQPKIHKGGKSLGKTSSATRLFGMLKSKISRTKVLFSHPEEPFSPREERSDCASNLLNDSFVSEDKELLVKEPANEIFSCHLCPFDADRITALDRHLLNDHKIRLENLLKLVMAKTRDGLSEDQPDPSLYGLRQPYYKAQDEIIEVGDFVMETVTSKVKILRNTATNTDLTMRDFPNLLDVQNITKQVQNMKVPSEVCDKDDLMTKMQTLNEYMCKYADSSNALKRLTKEYGSKYSVRDVKGHEDAFADLDLGDQDRASWEKSRSERFMAHRHRFDDGLRGDKPKINSESFYY